MLDFNVLGTHTDCICTTVYYYELMSLLFSYRKRSFSTFSGINLDLLSLRRLPAELNKRSLGTLVAVTHRNRLARVDKNL